MVSIFKDSDASAVFPVVSTPLWYTRAPSARCPWPRDGLCQKEGLPAGGAGAAGTGSYGAVNRRDVSRRDAGDALLLPVQLGRTSRVVLASSEPQRKKQMRNCYHRSQVRVEENLSAVSPGTLMKREKRLVTKRGKMSPKVAEDSIES